MSNGLESDVVIVSVRRGVVKRDTESQVASCVFYINPTHPL